MNYSKGQSIKEERGRLRALARARRAALSPQERLSKSAVVCDALREVLLEVLDRQGDSRATVAVYAAFPEELSLVPFIEFAYDKGCSVAFPCMMRDARSVAGAPAQTMEMRAVPRRLYKAGEVPFLQNPLRWFYRADAELAEFPYIAASDVAFLVVPVVGFDGQGNRLGYGKGNYDRYLAQLLVDVFVSGNPERLKRLVGTLADNAGKYAGSQGEVSVTLHQASGKAQLSVHNTGAPIAPEDLPHVFDRFYRASKARTHGEEPKGTGLGLAIAHEIVIEHGGTITATSLKEAGTTFCVTLPLAKSR